jgi:hypothetical protein
MEIGSLLQNPVKDPISGVNSYYDCGLVEDMEEVCHLDLGTAADNFEIGNWTKWKYVFYADDIGMRAPILNGQKQPVRNYYYQILVQMSAPDNGSGSWEIVYDSGSDNRYIPGVLFESGFLSLCMASERDDPPHNHSDRPVSGGISPMFWWGGCPSTGPGAKSEPIDYIYNPQGTFAFTINPDRTRYFLKRGLNFYAMSSVRELRKILGIRQTTSETLLALQPVPTENPERFNNLNKGWSLRNPNMFPRYRGDDAGFNKLYQDGIKYNIEIPNFPVRTFNTTSRPQYVISTRAPNPNLFGTSVVVGNERPILYNVKSFGEDATDIEEVEVRRQLLPSNLKWLSLNNTEPLKLNELNVQVRRALDNVLATEITDCMVEVLIQSADQNGLKLQYNYNP